MVAALLTLAVVGVFEIGVISVAGRRAPVPDPEPPPAMALPAATPVPQAVAAGLRRQPFLPPLSAEAVADPGHGPLFTPDLLEVGLPAAAPPVTVPVPVADGAAPDEHIVPEPPPSEVKPLEIDLPTPVPVRLELDGPCRRVTLGPIRLGARCRR